jgi:preprotein translocase SecE subunit
MPETMDEKQTQPQPAPTPSPASKAETFRMLARGWVVLMGVAWAGTLAQMLSFLGWMGPESVKIGHILLRPGALAVGAAAGVALIVLVLKRLGSQMVYAKPGLGRMVRTTAYVSIAALIAYGAYALYMAPALQSAWWRVIAGPLTVFGKEASLRPILFPALAAFFTVMSVVFLLLNQDRWAEFLIETEGEIKKVSWPARKEYVGSAMIVVLVVAIVSGFLHFVDMGLSELMKKLGVGF